MSGELPDLNVKVTGDSDDAVAAIARVEAAEESLGRTSGKTKDKIKSDSKESSKSVDDFAKVIQKSGKDGESAFTSLGKAIDAERANLKKLQTDFKSGSGNGVSLFGDIEKSKADLSKLTGFAKTVGMDIAKEGEKAGEGFMSSFSDKMQEMGKSPILMGAVAALAVGITPIIAAAVGAGFSAAVIGGGILALRNDPQIKAAASSLKSTLSSTMSGAAQPLIDPLVSGIGALKAGVMSLKPELKDLFSAVGPDIGPLVDGIVGMAKDALPEFVKAAKDAQPIVSELGLDLPKLGFAFGDFIDTLAGAPGAVNGVDGAFNVLDGTLNVLGNTISFLSQDWVQTLTGMKAFEGLMSALSDDPPTLAVIGVSMSKISQVAKDMAVSFDSTGAFTKRADDALKALIVTQNAWMKTAQSNDDALLAMKQAESTFNDELKKGSKNWNENTKAGQAQVGNLNALNEKITSYYDGLAALHPLTEKQTTAELKATTALYNQAKQAGATKSELATLKGEVTDLSKQLASLHGKTVTVNMVTHFITEGAKDPTQFHHGAANSGVMGYANSGISGAVPHYDATGVYTGGPQPLYRFAEQSTRREALIAENGDGNRADAALREAASWRGMEVVPAGGGSSSARNGSGITVLAEIYIDSKKVATALVPTVNRKNGRAGVPIFGGG